MRRLTTGKNSTPSRSDPQQLVLPLFDDLAARMYDGRMPKTPASKPDDPKQLKRFLDMAREVEVDEREGALDRAFERVRRKAVDPKAATPKAASRDDP
jgi:hypothetical protein